MNCIQFFLRKQGRYHPILFSFLFLINIQVSGQGFRDTDWLDFRKYSMISKDDYIDSADEIHFNQIDSFLFNFPFRELGYTFLKESYASHNLDRLIDSCFKRISIHNINEKQPLFQPLYNADSNFAAIINAIDRLPADTTSYFSAVANQLKFKIKGLKNAQKAIHALLHLGSHFSPVYGKIFIDFIISEAYYIAGTADSTRFPNIKGLPKLEEMACYKIIGDFCKNQNLIPEALLAYSRGLYLAYEIPPLAGEFEERMGMLYEFVHNGDLYAPKAAYHFQNAASYYIQTFDSTRFIYELSQEMNNLSWKIFSDRSNSFDNKRFLEVMNFCFSFRFNKIRPKTLDYFLFKASGNYLAFQGRNDISRLYFQATLIEAMKELNNPDWKKIYNALYHLSWIYSKLGNYDKALLYINRVIDFDSLKSHNVDKSYSYFEKANILFNLAKFDEGKIWLAKGFEFQHLINMVSNDRGYKVATWFYSGDYDRKYYNRDSAIKYDGLYNSYNAYISGEMDELNKIEDNIRTFISDQKFSNEIKKREEKLSRLAGRIYEMRSEYKKQQEEYKALEKFNAELRKSNNNYVKQAVELKNQLSADSIKLANMEKKLGNARAELQEAKDEKEQAVVDKKNAENARNGSIGIAVVVIVFAVGFARSKTNKANLKVKEANIKVEELDAKRKDLAASLSEEQNKYIKEKIRSTNFALNPHFLGNLIGNLKGVLKDKTIPSEIFEKHLNNIHLLVGNFFRSSADGTCRIISEIERIEQYINVQEINYRHRKFCFISNYEEARNIVKYKIIPSNILFNVIENTFKHGFIDYKSSLEIKMTIKKRDHNGIVIEIANNGNKVKDDAEPGKGLQSIKEKINDFNKERNSNITWEPTANYESEQLVKTVFFIP